MSAICSIACHEIQNTANLTRHSSGRSFPYNPEFYDLASSLYGPGTIYCWYMLLVSSVINCTIAEIYATGAVISADLLAAIVYPMFAATDLMISCLQIQRKWEIHHAIACLRSVRCLYPYDAKYDLQNIPPDILHIGQIAGKITGPLAICYSFFLGPVLAVIYMYPVYYLKMDRCWIPSRRLSLVVVIPFSYVTCMIIVSHIIIKDIWVILTAELFIVLMTGAAFGPVWMNVILQTRESLKTSTTTERWVYHLVISLNFIASGIVYLRVFRAGIQTTPDQAFPVHDKDQLAPLIAGAATLLFNIYRAVRFIRANGIPDANIGLEEVHSNNTEDQAVRFDSSV
ncbi:hypothetical protein IQ07DRAFT_260596 [Pyrenochaeta sp. DS3sAY3a]|nr:hypothetical protein IQ07DRAFT_260596 [Pyrenochaeta sp. DS3sAY3a]